MRSVSSAVAQPLLGVHLLIDFPRPPGTTDVLMKQLLPCCRSFWCPRTDAAPLFEGVKGGAFLHRPHGASAVYLSGHGFIWRTQIDAAPLIEDPKLKYAAVVVVGHLLYGAFEWTRYQNFFKKGQVGKDTCSQHASPILARCPVVM
jgi:hypothetical protein